MFENLFERSGLSLDRLRTFSEIARHSGVTKAAKGNAVRQSQFSRQLKELETYFGTQLFVKKRNMFILTPEGKKLLLVANEFFASVSTVKAEIENQPQTISFGAGESIFNWLLFPRFSNLNNLFPNFRFEFHNLQSKEIVRRIQESELDFGIVGEEACPPDLQKQKLGSISYSLFKAKTVKPNKAGSVDNGFLENLPLATLEGEGQFKSTLLKSAEKHSVKLNLRILCSSFPLIAKLVKQGHISAILPTIAGVELASPLIEMYSTPMLKSMERQHVLCYRRRTVERRDSIEHELRRLVKCLQIHTD